MDDKGLILDDEDLSEDLRVHLSAERTLLSWIRTGLAMLGFGFVVARFGLFLNETAAMQGSEPPKTSEATVWIGTAMVVVSIVTLVFATRDYRTTLKRLTAKEPFRIPQWPMAAILALTLAMLGLIMTVYLVLFAPQELTQRLGNK